MSTYEVEHGTADPATNPQSQHRRRPDLSTFFATLSEISPDPNHPDHRPHAVPVPGDVSAAFYSLAEAFEVMRRENASGGTEAETEGASGLEGNELITQMIQSLLSGADMPPREVEGVSEEFCDMLDRVPKSSLKPDQTCPICSNPFLEDEYPLVVKLPCHPTHIFDLECVKPWLRLRGTCPLDRVDFAKELREKDEARKKLVEEDDEEEWDGMYG
ncbi:hypothetical protein N7478_003137 [Penicillium angulare]|uniref:uncharacterized protein n=1 Tax=Penicillium angulare TaxID=116970 RepID=UPI00253FEFCB|nr:uncharacterized protein N7478_003137 [Penicillium angulare]KAJ5287451.1 hypothetical protein N7478_003137 [Penicillium angulare]